MSWGAIPAHVDAAARAATVTRSRKESRMHVRRARERTRCLVALAGGTACTCVRAAALARHVRQLPPDIAAAGGVGASYRSCSGLCSPARLPPPSLCCRSQSSLRPLAFVPPGIALLACRRSRRSLAFRASLSRPPYAPAQLRLRFGCSRPLTPSRFDRRRPLPCSFPAHLPGATCHRRCAEVAGAIPVHNAPAQPPQKEMSERPGD